MSTSKINIDKIFTEDKLKYLELLGKQFPTISKASTEIINLQAILNLPKGTEHFVSDIHGEYESFLHVLKNASGVIKLKVDDVYGMEMTETEKKKLSFLIYYPEEMIKKTKKTTKNMGEWYEVRLYQLIKMARNAASKYTRSKVRKALPPRFAYILEELLHENDNRKDKEEYYRGIIKTIIDIDKAEDFIIALSNLIQRLVIDQLHIIGDIFDRGPGADIIMDKLCSYHSVDIQWGNHDVLWMGAAAGSQACICNVIRISLRYSNTDTLEDGYGINLLPLATFAIEHYKDEKNPIFLPKGTNNNIGDSEIQLISKMHKAISVIQFKLEGQIIARRKEFNMEDRRFLESLNKEKKEIKIEGKTYKLNDNYFPTIDKKDPYKLTKEEQKVIEKITASFLFSEKLQAHIRFLYTKGSLYLKHNSNLLFHACIPMTPEGELYNLSFGKKTYKGKSLYDMFDRLAREAYFSKENAEKKQYGRDILWYLWCGPHSPLFGKEKMTTFERYFIDDKETHKEPKNPFFKFRDNEETCNMILKDFGLEINKAHIFCGHVPVKVKKGESPIKANGKLLVIDGGFSKAYQGQTGIAGYTLIYNSHGLQLVSHEHFHSSNEAIEQEKDIHSVKRILEHSETRIRIASTDVGKELKKQIEELTLLLMAYRKGLIKETP